MLQPRTFPLIDYKQLETGIWNKGLYIDREAKETSEKHEKSESMVHSLPETRRVREKLKPNGVDYLSERCA